MPCANCSAKEQEGQRSHTLLFMKIQEKNSFQNVENNSYKIQYQLQTPGRITHSVLLGFAAETFPLNPKALHDHNYFCFEYRIDKCHH